MGLEDMIFNVVAEQHFRSQNAEASIGYRFQGNRAPGRGGEKPPHEDYIDLLLIHYPSGDCAKALLGLIIQNQLL